MVGIVKGHYFHYTGEKNLDGKNSCIFDWISHNTYNVVIKISCSF